MPWPLQAQATRGRTSKVAGRTRRKRQSEPSPWYTAGVRSYFVDSMIESRRCRDKSQGSVTRSEGQTGGRWAPKIPEAEPVMEKGNCLGLPTGVQNVMSGGRESGSESGQSEPVARGLSDLQLPRIPVDKRPGYMSCKLPRAPPRASSPGGPFSAFLGSQRLQRGVPLWPGGHNHPGSPHATLLQGRKVWGVGAQEGSDPLPERGDV